MNNIQEKDFVGWESKVPHGGPEGPISRTLGNFMFFGQLEGQWAYYDVFSAAYQKLNEVHPRDEWHGPRISHLIGFIRKVVSVVNLEDTQQDVLGVFIPKALPGRLLECPPKPKRGVTRDYSCLFRDSGAKRGYHMRTVTEVGGQELTWSMDSTDSWPPLDAPKNKIQAFFDAAFDKYRAMGLFHTVRDVVDIEILFDQPTSHPEFRVWIQFLFQRILAREWEKHIMVSKAATQKEVSAKFGDTTAFLENTLVEWRKSPKWASLTPNDCPVEYKFMDSKGSIDFEYEKVIIPTASHQSSGPDKAKWKNEEEKDFAGATAKPDTTKQDTVKQTLIQPGGVKEEDVEHKKIKEKCDRKSVKQEKIKEEPDLEVVGFKKVAKPWGGKRRFEDVEEFQKAINHPSVSKKPRYRVVQAPVYEILDSDEE